MRRLLVFLSVCLQQVYSGFEHSLYTREENSGEGPALVPTGCNEYDVRLVGENSSYMGLVEACYTTDDNKSLWGPICADGLARWTYDHALAVCNQLNFSTTTAVAVQYQNVTGPYSYQMYCYKATSIRECTIEPNRPTCMNAGGVICHVPAEEQCATGDVRLVNGSSFAGRLEVCFYGVWGTVCRFQTWNAVSAGVVCRQLGINATVPVAVHTQRYGIGLSTQPILLQNVECTGNERNISECMHSAVNIVGICEHQDDVGVACEAPPDSCNDTDIRLRGGTVGSLSTSGTIEVCFTGIWGTVCDYMGDWDEKDATVACRQLGYSILDSAESRPNTNISVQNILSGIKCSGTEKKLADCDHDGVTVVTRTGCPRAFVTCRNNNISTDLPPSPPEMTQPPTESDSPTGLNIAIIVGSTVGVIVSIVIILAAVFLLRERFMRHVLRNIHLLSRRYPSGVNNQSTDQRKTLQLEERHYRPLKNLTVSKKQLYLSNTIGQGASGLVYKGYMDTNTGTILVAIKTSKALFSEKDSKNLMKEMSTMASFEHPNVMSLIGVCLDGEMPLLIMPFMSKGSVLEYVRHNKEDLLLETNEIITRKRFLGMCLQIAKGMNYLSTNKFVHRDLAARNCMIDENDVIKVADFGLSEDMYSCNYFRRSREEADASDEKVPIRWMAPESIETGKYDEKTDVWAFGVTCWEIFTCGIVPYSGFRAMSILNLLKTGQRLEKPTNYVSSDEIYGEMLSCWSELPSDRPYFSSLVTTISDLLEREAGYLDLRFQTYI